MINRDDAAIVSIIIPVYNCEKYICKCISSICNQTYRKVQIIVIDDGSTDGSGKFLDEISDARLVLIRQNNAGVCFARNEGISKAIGKYITFLDADDYVDPEYIEKMVVAAEENNSDLVVSGFKNEDSFGRVINTLAPVSYKRNTDEMWVYRLSAACGRLYRKSFWDSSKLSFTMQNGVRCEDVPICLFSNYAAKNIVVLDYAGYHYVHHEGSATHDYVGLKKYGFPYEAMDDLAIKIQNLEDHNSREFLETGILKLFAHFYFYMGRGADNKLKREMFQRFRTYISVNCQDYLRSWRFVRKQSKLPLTIRVAVELFVIKLLM